MNTRTLVLLGALLIIATAGVVSLGDGSSDQTLPKTLSPLKRGAQAATKASAQPIRSATGPVSVAGLMINTPVHTGADPSSDDTFGVELAFFGTFDRTRLALELRHEDGGILGIDSDASELAAFRDDRGTNLLKEDDAFGPFEMMPRISEDGHYLVFTIASDKVPVGGAARVFAEGVCAVQTAHRSEVFTSDEIALAKDARVSLGGFDFKISDVGDSNWNGEKSITLETKKDTVPIVRYALIDPSGAEIELSESMSMSGMGTWQQSLDAATMPERAKLVLEVWQDLDTVEIPFQVEAGIGLR